MYIHMCLTNGNVLCSSLPSDLYTEFQKCNIAYELISCPIRNKLKRHGKITLENGIIYICSYDTSITSKIFKREIKLCESIFEAINNTQALIKQTEYNKIYRLEHNIVSYHKKIQDELDSIISKDYTEYKDWRTTINSIKSNISEKTEDIALSILHIIKDVKLMKAELDIYDLFNSDDQDIERETHKIHKLVNLAMQAFWIDFINKNIKIKIEECHEYVLVDYSSFSVVLGHIFDNATKYSR